MPSENILQQMALNYYRLGWSIIPLQPKNKKPAVPSWESYQKSRAAEEQIKRWWEGDSSFNIGIVTGAISGIVVLDIDGDEGKASVKSLSLPATPVAETGKGWHYYFKHPGGQVPNAVGLLPHVDLRGDGGYVVAPPSIHPSGRQYRWVDGLSPDDVDFAPLPDWVLERLGNRPRVAREVLAEPIPEGWRNATLTSIAGSLRARGADEATILATLRSVNQERCQPPLPDDEVVGITRSVSSYAVTENLSDLGNAKRLVSLHGQDLRYCHPWKRWLVWDGTRWKVDGTAEVIRRAKNTVQQIYAEASREQEGDRRKALAKHALKSEAEARIEAMVGLAASEPGIPVLPEDLDRDPWLLNVMNGTLDLRTGELSPFSAVGGGSIRNSLWPFFTWLRLRWSIFTDQKPELLQGSV
ncbi:MAG TPA: hypothetical protein GXX51_06270, partial [Firmicutes bacterium]|nr:hypothetical protein [Bacillota bacterium]